MKDETEGATPKVRVAIGGSTAMPYSPPNRKMRRAMKYGHTLRQRYNQAPEFGQRIRREGE